MSSIKETLTDRVWRKMGKDIEWLVSTYRLTNGELTFEVHDTRQTQESIQRERRKTEQRNRI